MFTRFIFIVFCGFLLLAAPYSASAYNATDHQDEDEKPEKEKVTDAPYLLPNHGFSMYFVRKPGAGPDDITLRIIQPLSVTGCMKIESPETEITKDAPYIWIDFGKPIVTHDDSVRYTHYECNNASNFVETDIDFSRKEFLEDEIEMIAIRTDNGNDNFAVYIDDHQLILTPKSENMFKPFKIQQREEPLTHWFYPENVVMLSVPGAPRDKDVTDQIRNLAYRHGFIDLTAFLAEFKPPLSTPNTLYFVDQVGRTSKNLAPGEVEFLGKVHVGETFQGPEGSYERTKKLDVHARLPGLFD